MNTITIRFVCDKNEILIELPLTPENRKAVEAAVEAGAPYDRDPDFTAASYSIKMIGARKAEIVPHPNPHCRKLKPEYANDPKCDVQFPTSDVLAALDALDESRRKAMAKGITPDFEIRAPDDPTVNEYRKLKGLPPIPPPKTEGDDDSPHVVG
jgi:hypothetical protein